ncbi:pyridoxal phosphate-dependent aminotransferase [Nocardioides marmoribigeumensis]|uniref:N-succinyldiaminopimelate aminotransferase n=1 Tax=Nocardioides marmoribigeumensis TaxID=433649 RepID=A0ABU2BVJ4_9ACTN|nr:pyridoxal phosphate-dependent aminotransferase [Nocardioides marmoribigeumensis]MDR7362660.1 N-succinyldiaminopimelate aminotransferase [Nocardioides marmoribigeumensis]
MPAPLPRLTPRLAAIPPTIFTTMSALAVRTGSLNLGQGFPDADGPTGMLEVAARAVLGGANQYAPGRGVPALREAVARHQQRHYGLDLDPETQVLATAGATEGLTAAILALVGPGDEVVLVEPYYDSYAAAVTMAGGVRRTVGLVPTDDGLALDTEALRAAVTDRTVALVLNTPHNPTGTVLGEADLAAVAAVAQEHDLVVVTDEVYEHLTFDGRRHVPLCTLPGMADRTITVSSAGKSFSVTGWKVGWVTGSPELVDTVMAAKQWLTFTNAAPLQPAVAHALDHEMGFVSDLAATLAAHRDLLTEGLAAAGLRPRPSRSTYFLLGDISHLGWSDATEFCLALPERAGVVAVPAQPFYDSAAGDQLVRWAFCKDRSTLEAALERLTRADLTR